MQPQTEAVAAKRVGQDDLRACFNVRPVNLPDAIWVLDVPQFGRAALFQSHVEQQSAHRPVGNDRLAGCKQIV